ncbi:hypothetical protein D3C80_2159520 [compost metagenome]
MLLAGRLVNGRGPFGEANIYQCVHPVRLSADLAGVSLPSVAKGRKSLAPEMP